MRSLVTPVFKPVQGEILEAEIRKVCGAFDFEPMRRSGLVNGHVSARRFGPFDSAVVSLEASKIARHARCIRQDPGEYMFLLVQDVGHCQVTQGDEAVWLKPGDMFLVDSVKPSTFTYQSDNSTQISLHIPRSDAVHRFGKVCTGGLAVSRHDPLWIAIRAVIAKMLEDGAAQMQLGEALLSLIGAYILSVRGHGGTNAAETLLSRALAVIDRHRADPAFGPQSLASHLNVSERMLQRHFRQLGETPSHRILHRRLALAHDRLTAGHVRTPESVTAIAFDCGFNDLSYFYREFRKKYGTTPGAAARLS
ncbi:helix-turn-helix domain-containing protein [Allorhizobium sp. BGMRC 0089]|uniref:helix-turn-helix domain-containing protein n=1 Tax=Allorhizobium sonneratiae TaxID=2934936 RepID=UPI0020341560|nr:helix-turn-helix domain-containing protein [Allorhizobium sonneratiae]MCM2293915.1 helix-turn-helix domain-containing protein [Allorhizobium sonneratiae]